ncbi:odorant receptor 13a-like [Augochlora pura]
MADRMLSIVSILSISLDIISSIFKDCVQRHQKLIHYCDDVEKTFSLIGLAQVLTFSLIICKNMEVSNYISYSSHTTGCLIQLFMFSYSCDRLLRESEWVSESAYNMQWIVLPYDKGEKMLRRDLRMVVTRARVPCCLTAGGFSVINLETFSTVISTAASYLTILRHY